MQGFIVVASLVSELAGGQNDPPSLVLNVTKNNLALQPYKHWAFLSCRSTRGFPPPSIKFDPDFLKH